MYTKKVNNDILFILYFFEMSMKSPPIPPSPTRSVKLFSQYYYLDKSSKRKKYFDLIAVIYLINDCSGLAEVLSSL